MNKQKKVVEEYYFGSPICIAEKILFIKKEERLAEYKKYLINNTEFGNVWRGVTGTFRGEKVSIIVTGVGPSMIGDSVYALDKPGAVCLYSGTCGGLHKSLDIGDYFIANRAVCGDGYTLHFGHAPMSITTGDSKTIQSLKIALAPIVTKLEEGLTFTTSSVVREADNDFWDIVDKKCWIIEMGAAPFYVAALASSKKAAAYFWVSDLPTRGKSFFDPLPPEDVQTKQHNYDRAVFLDLELLYSLRG